MRKIALIVVMLGLFILTFYLESKPIEIESNQDIEKLEVNTRVIFKSKVLEEKFLYKNTKLLTFENGIQAKTDYRPPLKEKEITILGVIENYEGKQIRALKIFS